MCENVFFLIQRPMAILPLQVEFFYMHGLFWGAVEKSCPLYTVHDHWRRSKRGLGKG
jgi:hypothetical protein